MVQVPYVGMPNGTPKSLKRVGPQKLLIQPWVYPTFCPTLTQPNISSEFYFPNDHQFPRFIVPVTVPQLPSVYTKFLRPSPRPLLLLPARPLEHFVPPIFLSRHVDV